eukprot:gnl/Chilomastix_cuspidata/3169.p1 GENE.gnl/Chilomastix_cuspidata/3169~~gnl/Chilomastix_cuspidata/3169.p1  ORF type:complete len:492 (+),score=180.54 gnl/Chilomastix_cuspidata/3169:377-1852(+)
MDPDAALNFRPALGDELLRPTRHIGATARAIDKASKSIYSRLRSIEADAIFVEGVRQKFSDFPMYGNLRCGPWYCRHADGTCRFKSTDGHTGIWDFSFTRLNFELVTSAQEHGGILIVDSTTGGKRIPDALSKTVPIWAAVVSAAALQRDGRPWHFAGAAAPAPDSVNCGPFFPSTDVVSAREQEMIRALLPGFTAALLESGIAVPPARRALRPFFLSNGGGWEDGLHPFECGPEHAILVLVCASRPAPFPTHAVTAGGAFEPVGGAGSPYMYIQGAGDDEEVWAGPLGFPAFWARREKILADPDACARVVAAIPRQLAHIQLARAPPVSQIAPFALFVGAAAARHDAARYSAVMNVGSAPPPEAATHALSLRVRDGKFAARDLAPHLERAVTFIHEELLRCPTPGVLIYCDQGINRSAAVALAFMACYAPLRPDGKFPLVERRRVITRTQLRFMQSRIAAHRPCIQPSQRLRKILTRVVQIGTPDAAGEE